MSEQKIKTAGELSKALTHKQRMFSEYYVGEARFNATEAARLAGYSEKTARSIGSENLTKPDISAYIDARLKELTLGANEVLVRLTEIANGKIDDLLGEDGRFDLDQARARGKTHLIKKLKRKTTSKKVEAFSEEDPDGIETTIETSVVHEEVEFEIYSAHEALRDLGKHHKLFTDKVDFQGELNINSVIRVPPKFTPEEWSKQAQE